MTLAERIAAARAALAATKDALSALAVKDSLDAAEVAQMEELTTQAERQAGELTTLERAEKALAAGARPIDAGSQLPATQGQQQQQNQQQRGTSGLQPAGGRQQQAPAVVRSALLRQPTAMDMIVRACVVALERNLTGCSAEEALQRRYPGSVEVEQVHAILTRGLMVQRAATNPAMTNVAGWAQELVREGYGAFMDALVGRSIVPALPLQRFTFDGFGRITIPARANVFPSEPNLAAAFRAEGAPIRVGRTTLAAKYLTPKSMGVIGTFTLELLRRSTPDIEQAIRRWMLQDTAAMLDAAFLSAFAGNAVRPAGMQAGLAAGDTAVSSGNTGADILNDMKGRIQSMTGQGLGESMVWVMNTKHAWGVRTATTPTGEKQFPDGSGGGIPIADSINVPQGIVFLFDAAEIAFGGDAPQFMESREATIHEESGDPNTDEITGAVLPIVDGAGVVAKPVRSFFQTNSAGVRAVWELDWLKLRAGAVQTITGVGW